MKILTNLLIIGLIFNFTFLSAQVLIFSDREDGARYLSQDKMDHYFEKVNPIELAIQLNDQDMDLTDRDAAVTQYIESYQDEVLSITNKEKQILESLMRWLIEACNEFNEQLLPDTIRMIVVKGNHYGESTFFTRGHAIVTSRASLEHMPAHAIRHVMLHELFHIISRYNAKLRLELYGHVGFHKIDNSLLFRKDFYEKILYNPDGVALEYGINLMMKDSSTVKFIPVISTKANHYDVSKPTFFEYINFQLYPLDPVGDQYFVRSPEACESLDMTHLMGAFFNRITMNTQYIIHPDEILADNFMYLFRSEKENKELDQSLLNNIKNSIISYEN